MGEFSKYKDIEAVMQKAKSDLGSIESEYQSHLQSQTIPEGLLVEIKDYLGNLRSALDYLWNKIPGAENGGNFPMANSQTDFENKTKRVDLKYLAPIEKWQQYHGQNWTTHFNLLRNKTTHLSLVPQIKKETRRVTVSRGGGSVSWGEGVTFGTGVSVMGVPIDPITQMPVANNMTETRVEIWVDFLFDKDSIHPDFPKDISALPFLKVSLMYVTQIISEVEQVV